MPHSKQLAATRALLRPIYQLMDPYIAGLEHVRADQPALYVANHTSLGVLDLPFIDLTLQDHAQIALVGLAHRALYRWPVTRRLLDMIGAVEGTRANCEAMMQAGQHILVFPGGGGEVCKAKGEKYQLQWKDRVGFIKMAIKHGYPIIPLASVGAEECYDIRFDRRDLLASPLGILLRHTSLNVDEIPPLVTGWGGTLLPRPERFYFKFGAPIATAALVGQEADDAVVLALREQVKTTLESALAQLRDVQAGDERRRPVRHLLTHYRQRARAALEKRWRA